MPTPSLEVVTSLMLNVTAGVPSDKGPAICLLRHPAIINALLINVAEAADAVDAAVAVEVVAVVELVVDASVAVWAAPA